MRLIGRLKPHEVSASIPLVLRSAFAGAFLVLDQTQG
jgi:hypothetical protein